MNDITFLYFGVSIGIILLIVGVVIYGAKKDTPLPPLPTKPVHQLPVQKIAPPIPAGSSTLDTVIIILLVILCLYWLTVAGIQLFAGALTESGGGLLFCSGLWNVFASVINLFLIERIVKKKSNAVPIILFLGITGCIIGFFQLFSGALLQACSIPLYIILGVLVLINRQQYVY